jgi:hypothetical protein
MQLIKVLEISSFRFDKAIDKITALLWLIRLNISEVKAKNLGRLPFL